MFTDGASMSLRKSSLLLFTFVTLLSLGKRAPAQPSSDRPPNFIVIFADDLGYGDIGCFGASGISTPNLDRMAAQGARLTSFYSCASVCTPARAGLLTGRYATRMGLGVSVLMPTHKHGLPAGETTIAEALKPRGYHTSIIGKWHLGAFPDHAPTRHGFDEFFGLPYSNDMKPLALYRNQEKAEEPVDQTTLTQRYTAEALKIIDARKSEPFFIYLAHSMPHIPLYASEGFRGKSTAGLYGDVIQEIDWSVGEILKKLEETGLASNTFVLFTSDNGPWYEGSAGPFRGRKGENWEGGQRVPTLAWWPGQINPGVELTDVISLLDVAPTLAALAGAKMPDDRPLDGRDLSPLIANYEESNAAALADRPFFYMQNDDIAAVRQGPWKLVLRGYYRNYAVNFESNEHTGGAMLFNLDDDPSESHSLASQNPEVVARLKAEAEQMRADLAASRPAE